MVEGLSITHEIDVIATKNGRQNLMECKYAHDQGSRISIQVPLYVRSRVDDIVEKRRQQPKYKDISFTAWVVTNARFSSDSKEYSKSKGINLLGWDYPKSKGLKDMIEKEKIFPLTILEYLSKKEKQQLMAGGIVTCSQLLANKKSLHQLQMNKKKLHKVIKELNEIC